VKLTASLDRAVVNLTLHHRRRNDTTYLMRITL
jgi:hypothetical protein